MFNKTFFMTNCDILVDADYEDMLERHKNDGALVTMVCALKRLSVPYGTVELDNGGKLRKLVEKPDYPLLTNTGLYLIEPEFLDLIPEDEFVHMTDLLQRLIDSGKPVGVYPINESGWHDMGQPQELDKMLKSLLH
jgi:NDP-sugar pyrophosphorylase family protein